MNEIQEKPWNDAELKKLAQHKQWFAQLSGFLCVACTQPRKKEEFGKFDVFRPRKKYSRIELPITYILCKECKALHPDDIYAKAESWLVKHNHIDL